MSPSVPTIKFNNGLECPLLGLGTWKSEPGQVTQAVNDAIDVGYRHFDCAHIYGNEKEVGEAIDDKISSGVVKREDLFITSKEGSDNFPTDKDGKIIGSDAPYTETWKAMEACVKKGLTKSIGISNFTKRQTEEILAIAEIAPVTNQIESHPYLNQKELIDFLVSKGITVTAYSPLGSPDRPSAKPDDPVLLKDPKVTEIAAKYGKSVGQVLIKYQIQRNVIVIPKSVNKDRIKSNFDIDFKISDEDMAILNSLNLKNGRMVPFDMQV